MSSVSRQLRPGLILEIAEHAGLPFAKQGEVKVTLKCPFHDDRSPSAVLFRDDNVFYCPVCTPDGGLTAKEFAGRLGVAWSPSGEDWTAPVAGYRAPARATHAEAAASFLASEARHVWDLARTRALDDECCDADRDVYDYLAGRCLMESWEMRLFGVLAEGMDLPSAIAWWPSTGYRIVAPLYDEHGELACIQARAIQQREPKTLFPKGSRAQGTVFASPLGIEVLRGGDAGRAVILAEGLTDYLALSTYSRCAVLSAPGTGLARSAVGTWARGRILFLALDVDVAGQNTVKPIAKAAFGMDCAQVFRLVWPRGAKDACEALKILGPERFDEFLENEIGRLANAAA